MATREVSHLYSTIKNISGVADKYFPFLPPHGGRLAINEERVFSGNIMETVAMGAAGAACPERMRSQFIKAVKAGHLDIMSTVPPVLRDAVQRDNKVLVLRSGTLTTGDPSWNSDAV